MCLLPDRGRRVLLWSCFRASASASTVHNASIEAERLLDRANHIFDKLVPKLTPEWLATQRTIRSRFGCDDAPPWVVLRHIVNHSTYHRGQVASKLKRLGVEQAATDFVFWAFEQIPQTA